MSQSTKVAWLWQRTNDNLEGNGVNRLDWIGRGSAEIKATTKIIRENTLKAHLAIALTAAGWLAGAAS